MVDETEIPRRIINAKITSEIASTDEERERARLQVKYGIDNVWDTREVTRDFDVRGFLSPFCFVTRKKDGVKGFLAFQHSPRFYFDFEKE